LEIFLGLWIAILNTSLNLELVVFIAIFADIATLAIAYDNAPFSKTPVKWNLPKLWGMSILLGVILAIGSWIALTTMFPYKNDAMSKEAGQGVDGGIVQNFGVRDEVLFLQISLSENWLIFITRASGPFWSSIPSWQLTGAILIVDIIATFFCLFGWFIGGQTSIVAVVRVWVFSFGVFCVMGGVFYLISDSVAFDNLMHGKAIKKDAKQRSLEDFRKHSEWCTHLMLTCDSSRLYGACFDSTREERVEMEWGVMWLATWTKDACILQSICCNGAAWRAAGSFGDGNHHRKPAGRIRAVSQSLIAQ
jgi:H+-transporting ATPase